MNSNIFKFVVISAVSLLFGCSKPIEKPIDKNGPPLNKCDSEIENTTKRMGTKKSGSSEDDMLAESKQNPGNEGGGLHRSSFAENKKNPSYNENSSVILFSFNGSKTPKNKRGDEFPIPYSNEKREQGGEFSLKIVPDGIKKNCIELDFSKGRNLYAQFNPRAKITREFMREYIEQPENWNFNTFDRLRFWIKTPSNFLSSQKNGRANFILGTFVKKVENADIYSDEAGGGHPYHRFNVVPGVWNQVIINTHPDTWRGESGNKEVGNALHPTKEPNYNYFDTLTRFYLEAAKTNPPAYGRYYLDEFEFYKEPYPENDDQVYSLCASFEKTKNQITVTWRRNKNENKIRHHVRYAFDNIHKIGWNEAKIAPNSPVSPLGHQGYNGMLYQTTKIDTLNHSVVYLAIKPENSDRFSQIMIPLNLPN